MDCIIKMLQFITLIYLKWDWMNILFTHWLQFSRIFIYQYPVSNVTNYMEHTPSQAINIPSAGREIIFR
jgi:hypothetical protein